MAKRIKLPGRAESAEVGGVVAGANTIYDDAKGKMQDVVNSEVDAELVRLEESKQENLTFDNAPTEGSQNPVMSAGVYTADKALSDAIEAILLLIPSAASALNQLADKKFVQDSVATSTATFRGTYNVVSDLHLSANASHAQIEGALDALSLGADTNDYCFVQVPDNESTENIKKTERYKFNGSEWAYEYDLNNSGFTAAQWEAINSNITALLVTKLSQLPTNEVLTALLAAKQDNLTFDNEPTAGSNNPVTSGGIATRNNEIVAMITALEAAKQDKLTFDSVPVNGSENPVMSGGVYDAIYLVQVALAGLDGRMLSAEHSIEVLTENVGILRTLYQALSQSDIIVGEKPTTGVANIIYRVPGSSTFADWMYYNGAWVKLAEYTTLDGYLYKGIATPTGSPAASAVKMFYFALIAGTYTNFGNLVVTEGISILKYDGANWTQDKLYYGDGGVFDISKYNLTNGQPTPYPDIAAALGTNGANVPEPLRKGGMSVKFIQSSDNDNKYVQYRLMATSFSTDEADWQGVDEEPVDHSKNVVESGGVYDKTKLISDIVITEPSVNLFDKFKADKSGYVKRTDGEIYPNNTTFTTDYIPIDSAGAYAALAMIGGTYGGYACYDASKVFTHGGNSKTAQFQEGDAYVRFAGNKTDIDNFMVVKGGESDYPSEYVRYGYVAYVDCDKKPTIGSKKPVESNGVAESLKTKVDVNRGANLFDVSNVTRGLKLKTDGKTEALASTAISDYIPVEPSTVYSATLVQIGDSARGFTNVTIPHCFYSNMSEDSCVGYVASNLASFTSPENAKYIRLVINIDALSAMPMLNTGSSRGVYEISSCITGYQKDINRSLDNIQEKLLFNSTELEMLEAEDTISSSLVNIYGIVGGDSTTENFSVLIYDVSNLSKGDTLKINQSLSNTNFCIKITDANGSTILLVATQGNQDITVPNGAYRLYCTKYNSESHSVQAVRHLTPNNVNIGALNYKVLPAMSLTGLQGISMNADSLTNGKIELTNVPRYLKKEFIVTSRFKFDDGNFNSIKVGVGYLDVRGLYIEVNPTEVKAIFYYNDVEFVIDTAAHGLDISTFLYCAVCAEYGKIKYYISSFDGIFSKEVTPNPSTVIGDFYNYPFVYADASTVLSDVVLSRCSSDFQHPVWIFGDSYMSCDSPNRWPYYMLNTWGIRNWLCCAKAGQNSEGAYSDLLKALNFGTPKYLVWCLGMNDNGSTSEEIAAGEPWKTYYELVRNICEEKGITLILQTIPSVPIADKAPINNIIKASGYRYIDVYDAMGADAQGNWYEGYLENPGGTPSQRVHTTALGAKAQAGRVLADFSEILQY